MNLDSERIKKIEEATRKPGVRIKPGGPLDIASQEIPLPSPVPEPGKDWLGEFADEGPKILRVDGIAQQVAPPPSEGLRIGIVPKRQETKEEPAIAPMDELPDEEPSAPSGAISLATNKEVIEKKEMTLKQIKKEIKEKKDRLKELNEERARLTKKLT